MYNLSSDAGAGGSPRSHKSTFIDQSSCDGSISISDSLGKLQSIESIIGSPNGSTMQAMSVATTDSGYCTILTLGWHVCRSI
jgi:hypothetical protein